MFDDGFGLLEALVHRFVDLIEASFEEELLVGELLLDCSLLKGDFLDLLEQELGIGIHGCALRGSSGVVKADWGFGWKWWWWRRWRR